MMKTIEYYMSLPYRLEIIPDTLEGGYAARYPDLPGCITCADTLKQVIAGAEDAKRSWLDAAIEDGVEINEPVSDDDLEQYSGQFKLRIPKSLHRTLSVNAKKEGVSMNQYCLFLLTRNDTAFSKEIK